MKIIVKGSEKNINLTLPTSLFIMKSILKLGLKIGEKYNPELNIIPAHAVDALMDELYRVKKRYGSWELVEVDSSDGEYVKIIL